MESKIKLIVVEDQQLFREGLIALLSKEENIDILFEAEHGEDCIQKLKSATILPDIALIDLEMPIMDGIELNTYLNANFPDIKVIMLSGHSRERIIAKMIQEGASGYLLKNCEKHELLDAIKTTVIKGFYVNDNVLRAIQSNAQKTKNYRSTSQLTVDLTQRELEVLQLICKEFSNAEIAEKLCISQRTVEGHRNNLILKSGSKNTAGLIIFAIKNGHIDIIT